MFRQQSLLILLILLGAGQVWSQSGAICNYRDGRGWVPCVNGPPAAPAPPPPDPAVLEAQRKAKEAADSNNKGHAAMAREDWAAAEGYFAHAVELAPDNAQYRYDLSEARRHLAEIADKERQERERQEKLERDKDDLLPKIKTVSNDGISGASPTELKLKTVTTESQTKPQPAPPPRIGAAANVSGDVSVIRDGKPVKVGPGFAMSANDHVVLGPDGHLQVQLLDETVFTLGPNSDMILDEFVYDPDTNATKIAVRITKGVFRFVTGQMKRFESKDSHIEIGKMGSVGIRGTDFEANVDDSGVSTITLNNGAIDFKEAKTGKVYNLKPGDKLTITATGAVLTPQPLVRKPVPHPRNSRPGR